MAHRIPGSWDDRPDNTRFANPTIVAPDPAQLADMQTVIMDDPVEVRPRTPLPRPPADDWADRLGPDQFLVGLAVAAGVIAAATVVLLLVAYLWTTP